MISTFFFPSFSALFSNGSQDLIAGQRRRVAIAMLLNLGLFAQCNQRLDRGLLRWIGSVVTRVGKWIDRPRWRRDSVE